MDVNADIPGVRRPFTALGRAAALQLKVCGLTEPLPETALAGVDAIGLNAVPWSRRYVTPEAAATLRATLPTGVAVVLVVADPPDGHVESYLQALEVDWLQFHGDESPERCRSYGRPYLKAFPARPESLGRLQPYLEHGWFLIDAPGPGGTGERADLSCVRELVDVGHRLGASAFVAGGLNSENVGDVVHDVRPAGVDVASGVEVSGASRATKSPALIQAFVAAARAA